MGKFAKAINTTNKSALADVGTPTNITAFSEIRERPFIISFRRKLQRGYRLTELEKADLKLLQAFFDRISEHTINTVDARYKRDPDKSDTIDGQQIQHYEVAKSFRIHGIYKDGRFEVVRIDPHHKVHK